MGGNGRDKKNNQRCNHWPAITLAENSVVCTVLLLALRRVASMRNLWGRALLVLLVAVVLLTRRGCIIRRVVPAAWRRRKLLRPGRRSTIALLLLAILIRATMTASRG